MATFWPAVGAIATVAAAGIAAWAARQSRKSAEEANAAAGTLAAIERDRRHEELAPSFALTLSERGKDHADLKVALAGGRLEALDEVTLTVLDETGHDHWARGLPHGLPQEEAEAFVWGPWEFNTGASAQVVSNRQTGPRSYSRVSGKNWDVLSLTRTRPGHWMSAPSQEHWDDEHAGQPIRLLITCRREGYEPWTLLHEVFPEQPGKLERAQASKIDIQYRTFDGAQARVLAEGESEPVHMVVVANGSERPIRNVVCKIEASPAGGMAVHGKLADVTGSVEDVQIASGVRTEAFVSPERRRKVPVLRAERRAWFAWPFTVAHYPRPRFTTRFDDDTGLHWQSDHDLHLEMLDVRDW